MIAQEKTASAVASTRWVGPTEAGSWLEKNHCNRRLRKAKIEQYAQSIKDGNWQNNGQAIIFDWQGRLVNGQHRLHAIITADVGIWTTVVTGVDPNSFDTIDIGASRTDADFLCIEGYESPTELARAARNAVLHFRDELHGAGKPIVTPTEVLEAVAEHPEIVEALKYIKDLKAGRSVIHPGLSTFLLWRLRRVHWQEANNFMSNLLLGTNLHRDDPIRYIRERLLAANSGRRTDRLKEVEKLAYVVKAWNLWRSGKNMKGRLIRWRRGGTGAEKFPKPI